MSSSPNVTVFGLLTHPALVISLNDLPFWLGERSQSSSGSEDGLWKVQEGSWFSDDFGICISL